MTDKISAAMLELGVYVTGVCVLHRGLELSLYPPAAGDDTWEAHAFQRATPLTDNVRVVVGFGSSPTEAVLACFKACEEAETV